MGFLILPHPLTNFELEKYYENELRFNGVYSRNNLPKKIKDGAYVINLDEYADVSTHWIALFCNKREIVCFDSFGVEHVPEEIKKIVGNKNIIPNIFRAQAKNSVMCGYFWIGFIDFRLAGKKLTDFTNIFSPHDFEKNDRIILSYFNISFTSAVGAPAGIASASFTLIFSLTTGIIKKLLSITRNKRKKHDKIIILAKSKLNSIETVISQALIDMKISHKKFVAIFKEIDRYKKMKENARSENEKQEIMRLSSIKSKT